MEQDKQNPTNQPSNNINNTIPDSSGQVADKLQAINGQTFGSDSNNLNQNINQKPRNFKPLIFAMTSLTILIAGLVSFLFFSPKSVQAQVESLVNLYFRVDHVRVDSAKIFAELLESQRSPERVGSGTQELGDKPFLSTRDELLNEISTNRNEVLNAISVVKSEEFSSEEVVKVHSQLEDYYKKLFEFEDKIVEGLTGIQNESDFAIFIKNIFEDDANWPAVLENDAKLRGTLKVLAEKNNVEFTDISYEDAFKQKFIQFDTPEIDPTQLGQAKREFNIPEGFIQANISISIGPGADVSDLVYGLRHDDTGKVINFMISEAPDEKEDFTVIINKLPQSDTSENITADIIPSELYPTVDPNRSYNEAKIDYGKSYLLITLYPDDPVLSPVHGDWTIFVLAPAGLEIVIGVTHL